ncbi:MAG: haloacid dehalogenase-like hydrolase [Polyangiaceae bacterium]|nr:haloacid dehalogenase-like hydrolase [Polyangiaceae bacterium]
MSSLNISCASALEQVVGLAKEFPQGIVAFDADGTLWSDDVGVLTFHYCLRHRLLAEESRERLALEVRQLGLSFPAQARASELATILENARAEGKYAERPYTEMQVWAYAGLTENQLEDYTIQALQEANHDQAIHSGMVAIARELRDRGIQTAVISASPQIVARVAASPLGFASSEVLGGLLIQRNGSLSHEWAYPLPYGDDKVRAGETRFPKRPWLAAFGDSDFDLPMMRKAHSAFGLGQKASLLEKLSRLALGSQKPTFHLAEPHSWNVSSSESTQKENLQPEIAQSFTQEKNISPEARETIEPKAGLR